MANRRAFRPADPGGESRLEARVALSHAAIHRAAAPVFHVIHASSHPRVAAHRAVSVHAGPARRTPATAGVTIPVIPATTSSPAPSTPSNPSPSSPSSSSSSAAPATIGIPSVSGVMSAQEQEIVDLVNQQREQNGLPPLQVDPRLVEEAQIQSTDMAELGQMDHTLSGAALPTLQSRAAYVGYNYSYLGENIAFNYPDDTSVMNAWMNSPDHRANILDPNYTQIGVGIAYDSRGEPYYTQEFGQPA